MKIERKKGSVLAFTLIIVLTMLVVSAGVVTVSTTEIRSSSSTDKATVAFQVADTGMEAIMSNIVNMVHIDDALEDVFPAPTWSCSAEGIISASIDSEKTYEAIFYRDDDTIVLCAEEIRDIAKVKVTGRYSAVERAISSNVCASGWESVGNNARWSATTVSNSGIKVAAVVRGGQIYTSVDEGENWVPRANNLSWYAISSSGNGDDMVAVVNNGNVYVSKNFGEDWTATAVGSHQWVGAAVSDDGNYMGAVYGGGFAVGDIFISSDSGDNWSQHIVGGGQKPWSGISFSSDGEIVAAVNELGEIYVSSDFGANWDRKTDGKGLLTSVAVSDDGSIMMAIDASGGRVYRSEDGGNIWNETTRPGATVINVPSVVMSADGVWVAVAVGGYDNVSASGYIFISDDGGASWKRHRPTADFSVRNWKHNSLSMSSDGSRIFAGTLAITDAIWKYSRCK